MPRRYLAASGVVVAIGFLLLPRGFAADISISTTIDLGGGGSWTAGAGSPSNWPSAMDYSPPVNTDEVKQMDTRARFRSEPDFIPGAHSAEMSTVSVPVQADATIQPDAPGVSAEKSLEWGQGMAQTWRREQLGPIEGDLAEAQRIGNERGHEVAEASSEGFDARDGDPHHHLVPQETGQSIAPRPGHDGGEAGEAEAELNGSDPVDPATGEFRHTSTDLTLSGVGLPFVFKRVYRSRWTYDGPLGHGWTHSFDERLLRPTQSQSAPTMTNACGSGSVRWLSGDGGSLEFRASGTGWRSFPDSDFVLAEAADGTWTITTSDGIRRQFDEEGLLRSVEDLNHNALRYRWGHRRVEDGTRIPAVSEITDSVGRRIAFRYDRAGYLETVSVPSLAISVRYEVDSASKDLVSVTNTAGVTERYVYDSGISTSEPEFIPTPFAHDACESACSTGRECSGVGETCAAQLNDAVETCTDECFDPRACVSSCNACERTCHDAGETSVCATTCGEACQNECLYFAPEDCLNAQSAGVARCNYDCTADARVFCNRSFGCIHTSATTSFPNITDTHIWDDDFCSTMGGCERTGPIHPMPSYAEFEAQCMESAPHRAGTEPPFYINTCIALGGSGLLGLGWHCRDECTDCYYFGNNCPAGSAARGRKCVDDCEAKATEIYDPSVCTAKYEKACTSACGEACGQACEVGCETSCTDACKDSCQDRNQCHSTCLARSHALRATCDDACVDACETAVAHPSGQVTFGRPTDLEHNLVEVYDGRGRLVLRNTYEPSIFSPDFDRVVRQEYGDAVIEFHAYDLGILQRERDAGRSVDAALIPPPGLVDAEPASVLLCPQCGATESIGMGVANFHYVGVDPGDYLAIDLGRPKPRETEATGRPRSASANNRARGAGRELGAAAVASGASEAVAFRWPVEGDVLPLEIYRWLEVHAEASSAPDALPARGRIYPLVSDEVSLSFSTEMGRVQIRGVLGSLGLVSFEGSAPEALRALSQGASRPLVTLVRGQSGWGAYPGVVKGAMRLTPSDACSDEFSIVSDGSGTVEVNGGACRGSFAAEQLGRRAGGPTERAFVRSEEPLSAVADVQEWAVDGARLSLTRRSTVDAEGNESSWARNSPRSGSANALDDAGANPREVCFDATPILPEPGCTLGASMLE
ncbi:MAG: hypothetical protein IPK13_12330 [Deltaproteobacteria bacterium]|nr:hypothetical protein [Deltaproteobacteria bacterium]